jgi:hypothetical protein
MSAPVDQLTGIEADPGLTQLKSHAVLLHDISKAPLPNRFRRPNAIIVPATRPASALEQVIGVAAGLNSYLVVLCSLQADPKQVADRIRRRGARGLAVDLGPDFALPVALRTMSREFAAVNAGRASDLSAKRNFGLLLARRRGWEKIVFIDDDISITPAAVGRLAHELNDHPVAGMACRRFPDNSVFCHARRKAGFEQDVFVTGAVLGVNCAGASLPFFPDVYNEDWFYFGEAAARRTLTKVAEARQKPYNPFAEHLRAAQEEFGDLLAEGLYLLMERLGPTYSFERITRSADAEFWDQFIDTRLRSLGTTRAELSRRAEQLAPTELADALKSLDAAEERYHDDIGPITSRRCVEFLEAWRQDDDDWRRYLQQEVTAPSVTQAVAQLGAKNWMLA